MRLSDLVESETLTNDDVRGFAAAVKERLGLSAFDCWLSRGDIRLNSIIVGKKQQGSGTAAMEQLVRFADQHRVRITLTPALRDDHHGTTSRARLVRFYKRFGFKENKGRNKDFAVSDGMIRDPK